MRHIMEPHEHRLEPWPPPHSHPSFLFWPCPHSSSPWSGSLARPSCPMMYCGRSVLMPWPSRAWPSAASSRW